MNCWHQLNLQLEDPGKEPIAKIAENVRRFRSIAKTIRSMSNSLGLIFFNYFRNFQWFFGTAWSSRQTISNLEVFGAFHHEGKRKNDGIHNRLFPCFCPIKPTDIVEAYC